MSLDVVHSHAVKNTAEGSNIFGSTEGQFFHAGEKGDNMKKNGIVLMNRWKSAGYMNAIESEYK